MTKQMQSAATTEMTETGNTVLYDLRMKFERAAVTQFDAAAESMEYEIERQYAKTGQTPKRKELSIMGATLEFIAENIEREAEEREIMNRSASEWRQLEYEHVTRSEYSEMDMRDEVPPEKWAEYHECEHRFCINVWKPRRKDQRYCDSKCRRAEHYARAEFERTSKLYANGTYLPEYAYKTIRDAQERINYKKRERLFESETLTDIAHKEVSRRYGGKRDRVTEGQRNRSYEVDKDVKRAEATKPSEVITVKRTAEEIDAYLKAKYPRKKLK